MVDNLTPEARSLRMASIGGKNTAPELIVRRLAHGLGYRFRLHKRDLPGTPDLAFPARRKVIFVHGCYWHGHACRIGRLPKSNLSFWSVKIEKNKARDARNLRELRALSWNTLVVWQCETRDLAKLGRRLRRFLGKPLRTRSTADSQRG